MWIYYLSVSSRVLKREVIISWAFREIHTSLSCEYEFQNKINQGSAIKYQFQFYFFNFHSGILNLKPLALCQWLKAPFSFPLAVFIIFLVQFWQKPIHHWPPMHHGPWHIAPMAQIRNGEDYFATQVQPCLPNGAIYQIIPLTWFVWWKADKTFLVYV